MNKNFKANQIDAMMIPMNIRSDDFYFTLVNMKKSHVNGALISSEFTTAMLEIVDDSSSAVKKCGLCDFVVRNGDKLYGDIVIIPSLINFLKQQGVKKVALIGTNSLAKAFVFFAKELDISYFFDNLEELAEFCSQMDIAQADINRIASGTSANFEAYDAVIDFADLGALITTAALICVDLKLKKEYSPLREMRPKQYIGFEELANSEMIAELIAPNTRN